ncbi:MAG: hypothetical protein Ct9H90mP5_05500 [Acidimicrobiaceae bacterium]|nr:MAG: hypothetical protein Ct9H90mP5_05500 [Acidimicrobiaceae bacterium]
MNMRNLKLKVRSLRENCKAKGPSGYYLAIRDNRTDDVGVSVAAKGIARLLKGTHNSLPQTGGILMHDVRDLARVLSRCLTAKQGPRRYGVFGHYLDWPETEIFLESVTGKRLRTITLPNSVFHTFGRFGDLLGKTWNRFSARFCYFKVHDKFDTWY